MTVSLQAPKMVFDENDELVEVIISATDFRMYLRSIVGDKPWDELPPSLQDAVDRLLIDDVRGERGEVVAMGQVLDGDPA